jgi:flavin reductase (DIM6/NTAB) family NADH-FMN oxidoreductase RutF
MTSGRKTDKFEAFPAPARSTNGLIYSAAFSNMYLSVRITDQIDLDDHTLFIGEVTEDVLLCDKKTCTYDYYLKKITPKSSL